MADAATVKVEGLAALIRSLKAAEQSLDELKEANRAAARVVLDEAERRVPRRTGRLAATGRTGNAAKKASVIFGRASVPYAGVIERGWPGHNIRPQPYVVPAVDATRDDWLGTYERDLQRILDSVKGA